MTRHEVQTFKPRVAPRDWADIAVAMPIGLVQAIALFLLPALLVDAAFGNRHAAVLTSGILGAVFLMCTISNAKVGRDGIRFTRLFGNPKFLPWSEITSVREASRRELILHGWLWPMLPPREMSLTCTALGHVRIQFGKRFVYFPPADPQAFIAAIEPWLGASRRIQASK